MELNLRKDLDITQKIKPGARERVPYERPILFFEVFPLLKNVGFKNINCEADTFAHRFFPKRVIDVLTKYENAVCNMFPFKYLGHWITIYAEK